MQPTCEVITVAPTVLALTQAVMPRSLIPVRIRGMYDVAYTWLRTAPVRQAGRNFAVYDQCTPQSLRVQVGFPVSARFADAGAVQCVELAPGHAARAVHVGPYSELHRTYAVLHAWCSQRGLALTGESWEVYGDWNDDPSKLTTELFLRVERT